MRVELDSSCNLDKREKVRQTKGNVATIKQPVLTVHTSYTTVNSNASVHAFMPSVHTAVKFVEFH